MLSSQWWHWKALTNDVVPTRVSHRKTVVCPPGLTLYFISFWKDVSKLHLNLNDNTLFRFRLSCARLRDNCNATQSQKRDSDQISRIYFYLIGRQRKWLSNVCSFLCHTGSGPANETFTRTTFGGGLGRMWPHSLWYVTVNVSWVVLKDRLLISTSSDKLQFHSELKVFLHFSLFSHKLKY